MRPTNPSVWADQSTIYISHGIHLDPEDDTHGSLDFSVSRADLHIYLHADGEALGYAESLRRAAGEIEIIVRQRRAARQAAPALNGGDNAACAMLAADSGNGGSHVPA